MCINNKLQKIHGQKYHTHSKLICKKGNANGNEMKCNDNRKCFNICEIRKCNVGISKYC